MCKPKSQLIPSVWRHTDYVAFRFAYYSVNQALEEIVELVQEKLPQMRLTMNTITPTEFNRFDIDNLAHDLHLTIDVFNNETLSCLKRVDSEGRYAQEIYVGRFYTQVIFKKVDIADANFPMLDDMLFLLDYFVETDKLNIQKMSCAVHTIMEDKLTALVEVTEPIVTSDLSENNVSQTQYTDTREDGDFRLESKRIISRSTNNQEVYKLDITGVSFYKNLTVDNFKNSYEPLMKMALLENTRYYAK